MFKLLVILSLIGVVLGENCTDFSSIEKLKDINGSVYSVTIDQNDEIYVVYQNETDKFVILKKNGSIIPIDLQKKSYSQVTIDHSNRVYFFTIDSGEYSIYRLFRLIKYDNDTIKTEEIGGFGWESSLIGNGIWIDSQNNVFIGSPISAFVLEVNSNIAKKIPQVGGLSNVLEDIMGNMYLFSDFDSFSIIPKHEITEPTPSAFKINGLSYSFSFTIQVYFDKENATYVTSDKGLFKINNRTVESTIFSRCWVIDVLFDDQNNIYNSVKCPVAEQFTLYKTTANGIHLKIFESNNIIHSNKIDSKNNIYFNVDDDGLYILKYESNVPKNILKFDPIYFAYELSDISIDGKDNVYISLKIKLINNPDKQMFSVMFIRDGTTTAVELIRMNSNIYSITFDSANNAFIGTNEGLYKIKICY